jgi:hypothetical protein
VISPLLANLYLLVRVWARYGLETRYRAWKVRHANGLLISSAGDVETPMQVFRHRVLFGEQRLEPLNFR